MTDKNKVYAVITGDIVGSSKFKIDQWGKILNSLKDSWNIIDKVLPGAVHATFGVHRGDGFQGVLGAPEKALTAVMLIRARLRSGLSRSKKYKPADTRIAIGIGAIEYLPGKRGAEGRGEAYSLSGPILDEMKGDRRLLIRVSDTFGNINEEFNSECALLDALINRWSEEQAQVIPYHLMKLTQGQTAKKLGITQPAVSYRLEGAGVWALDIFIQRFEQQISQLISQKAYNLQV